jgi:hypothetical protein
VEAGALAKRARAKRAAAKVFLNMKQNLLMVDLSFSSYRTHSPDMISLQVYSGNRVFALEIFLFQNK